MGLYKTAKVPLHNSEPFFLTKELWVSSEPSLVCWITILCFQPTTAAEEHLYTHTEVILNVEYLNLILMFHK